MSDVIFILCALTSVTCAALLYRGYRRSGQPLLLWSFIGFTGLAISNILLVVDLTVLPEKDLSVIRLIPAALGLGCLLYGLIWEVR